MAKKELSVGELSAAFSLSSEAGAEAASAQGAKVNFEPGGDSFSSWWFVMIPDGTSPEAKFAKEHYGAGGAETPHYSTTIPVNGWGKAGNKRYAEEFASGLRSCGIEAKATDWQDTDD